MTASRARSGLLSALALLGFAAGPALAQSTSPGVTSPGVTSPGVTSPGVTSPGAITSETLGPPTSLLPFDPSSRQGGAATGGDGRGEAVPQVQGIAIDRLDSRDPNALGIYDPAKAGLGRSLWLGSRRSTLAGLISALPGDPDSRVLRDLEARLLLVAAAPPQAAEAGDLDWLTLRIERLAAMGEIEALSRLLAAVPRHLDNEPIQRARVETALLTGDLDGGCREIRDGVAAHPDPWWQRSLVICQLVAGERAQAQLGLELLRERGLAEEEGFLPLFDILAGLEENPQPTVEAASRPLGLIALRAKGLTPPEAILESATPGLLVALAGSRRTPPEMRILAAEQAAASGLLPGEALAEAYRGFAFGGDQLQTSEEPAPGPSRRALLFQRVGAREDPEGKAAALRGALAAAEAAGAYRAMLQALLPEFGKLPVEARLAWAVEPIARGLYAAGSFERAEAWYALARDEAVRNAAALDAVPRLAVFSRLAGGIAASLEAQGGLNRPLYAEPADLRGAEMLRGFFQALETEGAAKLSLAAVDDTAEEPLDLASLEAASRAAQAGSAAGADGDRRKGESLLRTVALLGETRLEEAPADDLIAAVSALNRAGLGLEARSLAIEAALASGV